VKTPERKVFRCAIYTRKSTEHNLDLEFNSLDAQREACEAYIKSQAHEGWRQGRPRPSMMDRSVSESAFIRPASEPPATGWEFPRWSELWTFLPADGRKTDVRITVAP
jgi:hypothetical protein